MKEGLRSSTLSQRGKTRADFSQENAGGEGRKGVSLNSGRSPLFNGSSPYSLRSKGQKGREAELVECNHNADAGSDKAGDAECNADVGEKGFSVISCGLESTRDLVTNPERFVEERGRCEQDACSNDADHAAKEERESLLVLNGLDPGVKEEIRSSSLILNHSSTIVASTAVVSGGKIEDNASVSESEVHETDTESGVCLNSIHGDGVVFSNGDEEKKKAFSSMPGNSLSDNDSENVDVYLEADKSRHEHGHGLQSFEREDVDCPRQENVINSNVDLMHLGSSLNFNIRESAQDLIISSLKENFDKSANKHVSCMGNGDGELTVNANGDASAVAEKGEIDDSQMVGSSAANKCLKEERVSPPASVVLDSAQESACLDTDINVETTSGSQHMECAKDADGHDDEVTVADIDVKASGASDEGMLRLGKRKRGRKRKTTRTSECNEDDGSGRKKAKEGKPQFTERVLRSRTAIMSGGYQEVDSASNECILGRKRKIKTECPNPDDLRVKIDEADQPIQRPVKKLKRRGRPPKVQEYLPSTLSHGKEMKDTVGSTKFKLRGRPPMVKKGFLLSKVTNKNNLKDTVSEIVKRRGRPPKVFEENLTSQVIHESKPKDVASKIKRRGRPPKAQGGELAPQVIHKNKLTGMIVSSKLKRLEQQPKVLGENLASQVVRRNKLKNLVPKGEMVMGRKEQKQLVRDQINSMILDAGWTIDHRPRQSKDYIDAVYVDTEEKTYWSSTKAYRSLKARVEGGVANDKEIAAFTYIPDDAFSTLFRHTNKEKRRKGKKGNKLAKGAGQTDFGTTAKEPKMKKRGKKGIDGAKGKVKLKADRSLRKKKVASSLRVRSKPRLLARSSEKGSHQDSDGFMSFSGKRSLLSWMVDLGTILPGWKVRYGSSKRKKIRLEGTVNRDGIHCACCEETMSISEFEVHASGGGKLGQPFNDIILESGTSLWQCMLDSWRKEEESRRIIFNYVEVSGDDQNDDTCNLCGDGGDLLCCEGCPSTFHLSCLDMQKYPSGKWHCLHCSCKFCGMAALNTPPTDDCPDPTVSELLSCNLCELKFHQPCSQVEESVNVDSLRPSFCGRKCREIFERLQMYIGVRHELEEGFSWTLLQRSDISHDLSADADALKVECNSKLAVAFSIMDECFVPIIDERSGINLIQNVVYNCGSNFRRLNYGGFCTAILERGDEIISAASIRIHGDQVAEMPFIGTRNMYRRQGMCRRLLTGIESALGSLDVEKLVIPAITEMLQTWTSVFGFKPLEEHKRRGLKGMSLIVFPGTDMLEKPLLNLQPTGGNTIAATDEHGTGHQTMSCAGSDSNAFSKLIDGDPSLHLHDGLLNDTPKHTDLSFSCGDNPLGVSKNCSYDNGHSIPANVNTGTKAQSGCASLILDDTTMEGNTVTSCPSNCELDTKSSNAPKCEQRPMEVSGECEEVIDREETREIGNLVNSEQLHFSLSQPDYTSGPCSLASVTGELCKSVELPLACSAGATVELVSEDATKVTFDLNKDLAAETDSDSAAADSLPQRCAKAYELSDSGSQADKPSGNLCDADPCTTQALVLV